MSLMPKKSAFNENSGSGLVPASIVMYENDNSPILAAIIDFKKGKYVILNQKGREIELSANRLYPFSELLPSSLTTKDAKAAFLEELATKSRESAGQVSISDLWEMLKGDDRVYTCLELAKNYLGKPALGQHVAFRLALLSDKIYFKRKEESFSPRIEETVLQLKAVEEERKKKIAAELKAYSLFSERIKNPELPIPDEVMPLIYDMEVVAAEASNIDASTMRDVRDFIHNFAEKNGIQLSGSNHERVFNFLRLIKHFDNFTNLSLIRHRLEIEHTSEARDAAKEVNILPQLDDSSRIDLTKLDCFTIDDSTTKDMDDAISLEYLQDGFRLGIHISDVSSAFPVDSVLDKESYYRLTSLYLPDQVINMLPEELSQDKLSLVKGEVRPALSFLLSVNRGFEITDCEISLSKVLVKNRYNYEEANTLLEDPGQHIFEILHNISVTHEMKRIESGAIQLHKKEAYVHIKDKGHLELQEIDENSPSRRLISELMIIANSHLASFAKKNNVPLIYRTQEKPERDTRPQHTKSSESPSGDMASRMNLKKSLNTTTPKPHAGLGMELYCQATSPIRRYLDICNQRQVVGFLKNGNPLYSDKDLRKILAETDEDLQRYNVINRESKRFWLLKYLEMHVYGKKEISGTVVRTDLRTPLVELEDVYIGVAVKLDGNFSAGDKFKFKITAINPAFDFIKLEPLAVKA